MLSYTQRQTIYGDLTNDSSTNNLTFGQTLMNEAEKRVINARAWDFTQGLFSDVTVADQNNYKLPVNYRRMISSPTITVGGTKYTPQEVPDRATFDRLSQVDFSSDIPQWFYIFSKQVYFFPTPSSSSNTIEMPYEKQQKDMNVADYTTGSITTATNGSTAIVGTGTSWNDSMIGKYIRITADATADSGDNEWYKISAVPSTTSITLDIAYEGTSISSATQGYTIAQMSSMPDGYDLLPVYKAVEQYYLQNADIGNSDRFKRLYDELLQELIRDHSMKSSNPAIAGDTDAIRNPNLFITQ